VTWGFSVQLLSDEEVIDDSVRCGQPKIKSSYSVFLTNKRVIFRFDGLGSSLTQSFFYHEIVDAKPRTRLFVNYIQVTTPNKDYFLNVPDPAYWSKKALDVKQSLKGLPDVSITKAAFPGIKKKELLDMLTLLRKNLLLTDGEFEEKVRLLDSMKF
jgi:hypothetical protein